MIIKKTETTIPGIKFQAEEAGRELGRAFLYILRNDLHEKPFAFIEDVFVAEECRGRGVGSELVRRLVEESKSRGCYKIIMTSRYSKPQVHALYERLGFRDHGKEFRLDL
jgi:GNAT superfamily N-acetyltransferase